VPTRWVDDQQERWFERRAAAPPSRPPAPPAPAAALLALQRSAGNRAVADLLARRSPTRSLARSCDEEDEAAQRGIHSGHVLGHIARGDSLTATETEPEESEEHFMEEVEPEPFESPPPSPGSAYGEQEVSLAFGSDDEGVFESDFEDEEESPPASPRQEGGGWLDLDELETADIEMEDAPFEPDPLVWVPELQLAVPLSYLRALAAQHETGSGPGERRMMLQRRSRTLARTKFKKDKTLKWLVDVAKAPGFTGFAKGDNPAALAATGVGERTKVKRRGLQAGSATNSTTRPPGWWDFITLIGFRSIAHCSYVMGHLLNKDFGGLGTRMYNLAPFTSRLNALHKTQVESPLRDFIKGAAKGYERKIDYKVKAEYGSPSNVITDAKDRFDDFLSNHRKDALKAWVSLGIITAKDAKFKKVRKAALTDKLKLPSGKQWDTLVTAKRNEVTAYVKDHFPESIWCTAREYERQVKPKKAPDWVKTSRMTHRIDHVA
jgi:hypothetical protein